eukprot:XP_011661216.1 PREDICTED: polyhomeotic-like protein 2 isoform X1 [Strongylocentrotus purpuratus]
MANLQANPQDLSSGGSTPSPVSQPPQPVAMTAVNIPTATAVPMGTVLQVPSTTVAPSPAINSGLIEGPLSAPIHKVGPPPMASPAGIHVPQRMTPSPKTPVPNPRSSPGAPPKDGPKDAEGQRVIVTTRTPIFVRSYSHAQTTQSSPNTPTAPRMTAAAIRPTPTGQVMPTTAGMVPAGMVQQVRPISSQVRPVRGHPRPGPGGSGRGNHGNNVRVLSNGPNRLSNPQGMPQNRAQILARVRSPGGLVIREHTPPSRSPPHAIRGQQPRIRIPISGAGRGVSASHSPVLITGAQIRAPFFPRGGTLLAYQPGNPRLQAALGGNHLQGQCVTMTSSGQFVVQPQPKMSPGNGQMSPRHIINQVRHGLVSPNRARMPSSMPNPSSLPHHKPILPSTARGAASSHQLLTVAGPQQQQHPHHAHRPTAQIRAHLPRISPRPMPSPVQAHSHHTVSDSSLHSTPDATPMNLVTSPKSSPQIHPVDMSAKSIQSPSSTTIPTQSHLPAPSHHLMKSEGSDSDTSSKNGRFRVTSTASSLINLAPVPGSSGDQQEHMEIVAHRGPDIIEHRAEVQREIPRAIVKPHVLTHVIDGFIIEESQEPFPVTSGIVSEANTTYKTIRQQQQQKLKRPAPEPLVEGVMLRCEFCGKVDSPRKFKRSKRFCSMACAKRYNVGCSKRLGLFSPRQPEKPEKTKHRLKLQLKAKPLKGQRGKHGRLTYNVAQPWSKGGQHDTQSQELPQETSSSSSSSSAPSEDMEHPSSPSPNVVLSSPSRSEQSFQYSDESDDLPPGVGRNPSSWSVENVAMFIRSLPGCAGYADEFQSQEIDGQALMLLKEDHLMTALSMKLGPALKIINKINTLKDK